MQDFQSDISAVSEETKEIRIALVATQQQLANLMAGNGTTSADWPTIQPPLQPTQYAAIKPAQYTDPAQYTAQAYQTHCYAQSAPPPHIQPPPTIHTQEPASCGGYGWGV